MIAVAAVLAALTAGSPETRAAGLVDVHRYGPGIRVELVYRTSRNLTGHRLPGYCRERALLLDPAARDLGPRAHALNATGRALRNRLVLERAMESFGFTGYWREWWHFEHRLMSARYLDLSLGC